MARDLRDQAKALLARGIDPDEHKKAALRHEQELANNTFEVIACEWHAKFSERWEPKNAKKILTRMEKDIFPFIGFVPITDIKPKELLATVRRIKARGAVEYAHRTMQYCGKVFRYAIATDRAERDISADLRGAIPPPKTTHRATIIDPKKVGQPNIARDIGNNIANAPDKTGFHRIVSTIRWLKPFFIFFNSFVTSLRAYPNRQFSFFNLLKIMTEKANSIIAT